jgi:hypothetical protein
VFPVFATSGGFPVNSVTASGFDWELWTVGNSIRVTKLYRNNNVDADPINFDEIKPKNANYQHVFAADPGACIDMIFAGQRVPTALQPGDAPPYYCLGRCSNTPIINTK